ncbi:hypothetical protein HYZ78_03795 [Candidatus Microgenomates bacterium]|nr:hypothetical protein [Candidatus Microgenomates bacterium]
MQDDTNQQPGAPAGDTPTPSPEAPAAEAAKCEKCGMDMADGKCSGCQMEAGMCACSAAAPSGDQGGMAPAA